jgi:hypothetical protein
MADANTLAYYDTVTITVVKKIIVQAWCQSYKTFYLSLILLYKKLVLALV